MRVVLICLFAILISCNEKKSKVVFKLVEPIEKWVVLWKNDSVGCNQNRFKIVTNYCIDFQKFKGSSIDSFELYFGKANYKKIGTNVIYSYFITCKFQPKYKFQRDTLLRLNKQPSILRIAVVKDTISDINISIP
jgi:hypothetical protein